MALAAYPSLAQTTEELPIHFSADEVNYDRTLDVVSARGNVEVQHEDRILFADTISFNQRQDVLTVSGNVTLLEPSGEVLFADYMEVSGDLKDGIVSDIRLILSDKARLAANGGRRIGGTVTELAKAVYSPCETCATNPDKPPLWQVKAIRVIHDKERRTIEYRDAWLEVAGVPVAYTPYLSHPDPTVKRESGFLAPSFGNSSDLGFWVRTPYFWAIDRQSDLRITPTLTSSEGPVLAARYRRKFMQGEIETQASVTMDSNDDVLGHIDAEGRFDIDDTWRWGFDAKRTAEDTYQRRYGFEYDNVLTSRLFAEGFRRRNYFKIEGQAYQDLRNGADDNDSPYAIPMMEYSRRGDPGNHGAYTTLDADMVALTRPDGADTRRLSLVGGWHQPYTGPMGDIYELSATLQTDVYHLSDFVPEGALRANDGIEGRAFPQIALDWRYPLVRQSGAFSQTLEPMVSLIASPYGNNPASIPNEDSLDFEFDDTNLFSHNRFVGYDRVEGGPRVNYGLKWGVHGNRGGSTTVLVGQSYRYHKDSTFAEGSGLEDNFSDYVGRIVVSPHKDWSFSYRTRIDKDDFAARRNEISLGMSTDAFSFSTSYNFFDKLEGSEFSDREEVRGSVAAKLSRYWRTTFDAVRDLADETGGMRSVGLNLTYEDECFVFATDLRRDYYEDRELKPSDSIILRFSFKTLGEFQTDAL